MTQWTEGAGTLQVGDKVKGVKFRKGFYKFLDFDEAMEAYVGVIGTVVQIVAQIDSTDYVEVEFGEESYFYPMELLTKEK